MKTQKHLFILKCFRIRWQDRYGISKITQDCYNYILCLAFYSKNNILACNALHIITSIKFRAFFCYEYYFTYLSYLVFILCISFCVSFSVSSFKHLILCILCHGSHFVLCKIALNLILYISFYTSHYGSGYESCIPS